MQTEFVIHKKKEAVERERKFANVEACALANRRQ